ncbi:PREDICTED: RNA-binding protein cabeza-like [Lupinus angustifolius]|uniref:RNA-binding protein cabeza-like n=1 Tax=Lupinus angustifolius TaxID=3871 RepID=UPI00092E87AA|nr:PREDICTED: RNA-binding protein cabeza-like [Lupinus angustifolius]
MEKFRNSQFLCLILMITIVGLQCEKLNNGTATAPITQDRATFREHTFDTKVIKGSLYYRGRGRSGGWGGGGGGGGGGSNTWGGSGGGGGGGGGGSNTWGWGGGGGGVFYVGFL